MVIESSNCYGMYDRDDDGMVTDLEVKPFVACCVRKLRTPGGLAAVDHAVDCLERMEVMQLQVQVLTSGMACEAVCVSGCFDDDAIELASTLVPGCTCQGGIWCTSSATWGI